MRTIASHFRGGPLLAQNLLLALASAAVFGAAGEGTARLLERPAPATPVAEYITRWTDGEAEFYTIKSAATGWPPWEDYNSEGVRDREHEVAKPRGVRRVACLGDSVTLGTGLAAEDAWPQLLQDRLDALGAPVEVLNVALGGWATRQERIAYQRIARKYRPDVVLLGVCLNDIPELHNNLTRPPRLLAAAYLHSALVRWAVGARRREIRRIEELFERPQSRQVHDAYARFFAEVDALRGDVGRDGAALALVLFPYRAQMRPEGPPPVAQEEIASYCRARGIPLVDVRPALAELGTGAFDDDVHLTAEGTLRVADAVAASGAIPFDDAAGLGAGSLDTAGSAPEDSALLAALGAPEASRRAAAARALGNGRGSAPRAVPALAARLSDADGSVRSAAAWALGGYREDARPARGTLVAALQDAEPRVRAGACWALGRLGPAAGPEAARRLVALLDDADPKVRRRAADALVRVGARCGRCVETLLAHLARTDGLSRAAASWALGGLGPEAAPAAGALAAALADGRADVRRRAAWALGRIGPPAHGAVPALIALVDDPAVGWSAIDSLGGIGPGAAAATPRLVRALRDESSSLRWRAAQALARLGPAAGGAAPELARAVRDAEANVRVAAADALGRLDADPEVALPGLAGALDDADARVRRSAAHALGRLGGKARARTLDLIEATRDSDALVRAAAARALHQVGPSAEAQRVLARLAAADPDDMVRTAARRGLREPQFADR